MAWYYGTYSCGHEGRVDIVGPGKDREWKKERIFSGLCPECYEKQLKESRNAENAASQKAAAEMELPELSGSPKQVDWANTLRVKTIEKLSSGMKKFRDSGFDTTKILVNGKAVSVSLADMVEMVEILTWKSEAKYWIDRRNCNISFLLEEAYKELQEKRNDLPEEVKEEIKKEETDLTVAPKEMSKNGIVSISLEETCIKVQYVKDDDFLEIVKSLGYSWNGTWSKKITEYSGSDKDRIAELGNKLLANGFTVRFPEKESRDMALSGTFAPECNRWVKYNVELKMLAISWKGYNDDLYQAAKKLCGSKYRNGSVLVPVEFFNEVLDFAETMGFQISTKAMEEIEKFKEKSEQFMRQEVKEATFEEKDGKSELMNQLKKAGVIEDLIDEA